MGHFCDNRNILEILRFLKRYAMLKNDVEGTCEVKDEG